jgi:hypothetical protein
MDQVYAMMADLKVTPYEYTPGLRDSGTPGPRDSDYRPRVF